MGQKNNRLLLAVIAGIVLWGGFHTLGAFLKYADPRPAMIVAGCFALFFGVWILAFWGRHARMAKKKRLAQAVADDARR